MRFEELSENRYIKGPDTVERYLLGLVQEYFKSSNLADSTSREYIIQRAVQRMKEEISFDELGVLSITMPNGEVRTGPVSISIEELGGEPLIVPKRTAFNVDFGNTANTACEGNDPRLSDARKPTPHTHETSDILGLDGIISTLTGKIDRVDGLIHEHDNQSVLDKLTYSGSGTAIDLTIIDTIDTQVQGEIGNIKQDIIDYRQEIQDKADTIGQDIVQIERDIADIITLVDSSGTSYLAEANDYTDQKVASLRSEYSGDFSDFVTKDLLSTALTNAISRIGSFTARLSNIIDVSGNTTEQTGVVDFPSDIVSAIASRGQTLIGCFVEIFISFEKDGKQVTCLLPYITYGEGVIAHSLSAATVLGSDGKHQLQVMYSAFAKIFPAELVNAEVIVNLYSKQDVTL